MIMARPRVEWRGVVLSVLALATIAGLVVTGSPPADDRSTPPVRSDFDGTRWIDALPARLAALDTAIARRDATGAAIEWRAAHALALRTRRWDALLAVGDAALQVDALARNGATAPSSFRAEARQAYLRALFQARAERSEAGVHRAADAFAALGDVAAAARARAMAVPR